MSKLGDSLVKHTKSPTIITKETEINPVTGNTKEVVVSSQFLDVMVKKNKKQNKEGTIILRIEPRLKAKFQKRCKKMGYTMSEALISYINEYANIY